MLTAYWISNNLVDTILFSRSSETVESVMIADAQELMTVPGIGEKAAQAIR